MEEEYKKFNELLIEKKEKYPNICKLWEGHINEKRIKYNTMLTRAIKVLETIESKSEKDLPMETIAFLYFLFQENIP
tara:strand:- start:332 stop:562 length:231 start_codon:yes stop_codon:yes gene_type:complete